MNFLRADWCGLSWSDWVPLSASLAVYRQRVSTDPGFYRVRVSGASILAYLGQTGRSLRERTRSLKSNVERPAGNPPWNDPHTAAPQLWVLSREEQLTYEVSVACFDAGYDHRQCMEDRLLFEYRLEKGESTLANHGRFHPRWRRPSNKKAGRKLRPIQGNEVNGAGGASLPPPNRVGDPRAADWLGLDWSGPVELSEESVHGLPGRAGVYRLSDIEDVIYVGQSKRIRSRLRSHFRDYPGEGLSVSWCVMEPALPHQLLERETDLVGSFYRSRAVPPRLQYQPNQK